MLPKKPGPLGSVRMPCSTLEKVLPTQIDLLAIDAAQDTLAPGVSTDALQHLGKSTVDSDCFRGPLPCVT